MENIKNILTDFSTISLVEMDSNIMLMDRKDTKYVFLLKQLPLVLEQLKNDYRVLEVVGNRISIYETLYFDTADFDLYYSHLRGKANRFKIRFRNYVESKLNFFEIKFKNNKGRTIKDRVIQPAIDGSIKDTAEALLVEKTPLHSNNLEPKFWVNYSRITLVNKKSLERITIDVNLHFKKGNTIKTIDNIVIAEVKHDKVLYSTFVKIMRKYYIQERPISKYCLGVINLFDNIKYNNFKPRLIFLKKKLYGSIAKS